jgi:hypothetical protein
MPEKQVFRFPDNATPNRVIVKDQNIYYGNRGESRHGHTVVKDGQIAFARSRDGTPIKK